MKRDHARRLLHRIAESIGGCTVAELGRRLSWKEYLDWAAYFTLQGEAAANAQVVSEVGDPDLPIDKNHPDYAAAAIMAGLMGGRA